jgi:branched-chain amino acid transport system permease protein
MSTVATLLVIGVATGAAYALFALGYALVYDVLGLMNLAHGDILMIATFVCLGTFEATGSAVVAVAAGLAVGAVAGAVVDQVAYRPLRDTGDAVAPLVAALGAALLLRNLAQRAFGARDRGFPDLLPGGELHIAGTELPVAAVAALAGGVGLALLARRLLLHTRAGTVVVAVAQDLTAARLTGLPVWLAVVAVYAVAGAVAAVGGILYASTFGALKLSIGWSATVIAFTAAVIGGRNSLVGAVVGGLALGVGTTFLLYFLPSGYREAMAFALLAVVLLARPERPARALAAD